MQPTPQDRRVDDDDHGNGNANGEANDEGRRVDEGAVAAVVPDLAVLDGLAERPPHEHAAVYEQVHTQLQSALSEIDDA